MMNKMPLQRFLLFSILCSVATTYASIPNHSDPTTFLGPTLKGRYTSALAENTAYSILGEAGIKNFRIGGTYGFNLTESQRFKLSAEYLWQKLTYAFFSGNSDAWVNQGALGVGYQIDLGDLNCMPQFDVTAYYSHAPNKNLSTVTGDFVDSSGILQSFIDERRIAGSTGAGISPGLIIRPWQGSRVSGYLNYDHVNYHELQFSPNKDAHGLGGTLDVNQTLGENLNLDLSAAIRKPFNNYAARVAWTQLPYYGNWTLGVDGGYTAGKNSLPNSYNVGLIVDYTIDPCEHQRPLQVNNYKNEITYAQRRSDPLVAWVGVPAVYMPQVLAIVDPHCSNSSAVLLSPIPNVGPIDTTFGASSTTIETASHFSGSNLLFSITQSAAVFFGTAPTATINPTTGEIVVVAQGFTAANLTITVTASSNGCASANSTFVVSFITD